MVDIIGTRLALWAIRRYQRHFSPIKGFSCPYRLAHGGMGCSGYGYRVIRDRGLWRGLALLDRRLARCGDARRRYAPVADPRLRHQRGECGPGCDCDLPSGWVSKTCTILDCGYDCADCGSSVRERWRRWRQRRQQR